MSKTQSVDAWFVDEEEGVDVYETEVEVLFAPESETGSAPVEPVICLPKSDTNPEAEGCGLRCDIHVNTGVTVTKDKNSPALPGYCGYSLGISWERSVYCMAP